MNKLKCLKVSCIIILNPIMKAVICHLAAEWRAEIMEQS